MNKNTLIETGTLLLLKIYPKDVFNIQSLDDVLNDEDYKTCQEWCRQIELFMVNLNNKYATDMLVSNLNCCGNGNRVNKQKIQNIVDILIKLE